MKQDMTATEAMMLGDYQRRWRDPFRWHHRLAFVGAVIQVLTGIAVTMAAIKYVWG